MACLSKGPRWRHFQPPTATWASQGHAKSCQDAQELHLAVVPAVVKEAQVEGLKGTLAHHPMAPSVEIGPAS